jgi:hypothetical protein
VLVEVAGVHLETEAGVAFARMVEAARRDGAVLAVTDGYRTYERQVLLKAQKGWLAARPGTSMHGWGRAVDFDTRVTDFAWLREHAGAFGWAHPSWAQPAGSKPEPWHWEYVGGGPVASAVPVPEAPPEPGALVATARFEPTDGPAGAWFDIHEGLEGLPDGARHYDGTALPGHDGNFAVAGYQRQRGGPLQGLRALEPGDSIAVRTPDGLAQRYTVGRRAELGRSDGWAVGPDPLDDGSVQMMTLTTASAGGALTVVWAAPAP